MWGEYYFDPKTKKISKKPLNDKHNVMFVEFILKNLNIVYDKIQMNPVGDDEVKKMIKKLELFNLDELPSNL